MLDVYQHGFVGGPPELRYTPGGEAVTNFRVGSTERWTDNDTGETKERTTWLNWECWGKSAENVAKLVKKGSQVLITGTIRNDSWDDAKSGEKRYRDRYVVGRWKLLDRKPREEGGTPAEDSQSSAEGMGAGAGAGGEHSTGSESVAPPAASGKAGRRAKGSS